MNTNLHDDNDTPYPLTQNTHNLITEIIYLRKRLKQMGYTGDCAYEKKLSGYFTQMIEQYEEELFKLKNNW